MAVEPSEYRQGLRYRALLRNASHTGANVYLCRAGHYFHRQPAHQFRFDFHHQPPHHARHFLRCLQARRVVYGKTTHGSGI